MSGAPHLALDAGVRRRGQTLAGGSPRRALRLSEAGWRTLEELQGGAARSEAALALGRRLLDAGIAHPRPSPRAGLADVTVVVPVRDRPAELETCLSALGPGLDVIVADDGSADAAAITEIAVRHGARLVRRERSGGPAAARNAALAHADAELIAFLDCDCVPERGWLHALAGHFDDPLVGAAAPRIRPLTGGGARRGAGARFVAGRSPLDMGRHESRVEPGGIVAYVPTAALVVRRRALGTGFDEGLRYGEDVDLVWRLRDRGWRVRYDPSVTVGHREPPSVTRAWARRFRYGTSAGPLARRHPGRMAPALISPWPSLAAALIIGRRRRAAAVIAAGHSVVLGRRLAALGLPRWWGARWQGEATYHAAVSMARYVAMFGLPAAVLAARRAPWALGWLALPVLEDWRRRRPALDPVRWTALALADDAAYGAGVWWSALSSRTARPLLPAVAHWRGGRSER